MLAVADATLLGPLCPVVDGAADLFFLIFLHTGQDDIQHEQSRAYADEGIGYVKHGEVDETEVDKVHDISHQCAVAHIADAAADDKRDSHTEQGMFVALIVQICRHQDNRNRGDDKEHPTMVGKHTECGTVIGDIRQMQGIGNDRKGVNRLQMLDSQKFCELVERDDSGNDRRVNQGTLVVLREFHID